MPAPAPHALLVCGGETDAAARSWCCAQLAGGEGPPGVRLSARGTGRCAGKGQAGGACRPKFSCSGSCSWRSTIMPAGSSACALQGLRGGGPTYAGCVLGVQQAITGLPGRLLSKQRGPPPVRPGRRREISAQLLPCCSTSSASLASSCSGHEPGRSVAWRGNCLPVAPLLLQGGRKPGVGSVRGGAARRVAQARSKAEDAVVRGSPAENVRPCLASAVHFSREMFGLTRWRQRCAHCWPVLPGMCLATCREGGRQRRLPDARRACAGYKKGGLGAPGMHRPRILSAECCRCQSKAAAARKLASPCEREQSACWCAAFRLGICLAACEVVRRRLRTSLHLLPTRPCQSASRASSSSVHTPGCVEAHGTTGSAACGHETWAINRLGKAHSWSGGCRRVGGRGDDA